jgi:hypothetical protein
MNRNWPCMTDFEADGEDDDDNAKLNSPRIIHALS